MLATHDDLLPETLRRGPSPDPARPERTRSGLLTMLDAVDVEGWEGETATALLSYVRHELVRPLTIDIGLRGGAASQAEATAWEAVWLKLCDPHLRSSRSPWGVIWQTARRAVLGEILAARWGTDWRRAWEHDVEERAGRNIRPISLEPLLRGGVEPAPIESTPSRETSTRVSVALDLAANALADAGWNTAAAKQIVAEVAVMEERLGHGATVIGWRPLAARLGIAPWQARRLTFALRGSLDRPGLLARLIVEGPAVADSPEMRHILVGTRARTVPSPTHRQRSTAPNAHHPQRVAS